MKLLTFSQNNAFQLGIQTDSGVLDVAQAVQQLSPGIRCSTTVTEAIQGGAAATEALHQLVHLALESSDRQTLIHNEETLNYGPCVTEPGKIICVGLNYRKHAEETNAAIPQYPILLTNSIIR